MDVGPYKRSYEIVILPFVSLSSILVSGKENPFPDAMLICNHEKFSREEDNIITVHFEDSTLRRRQMA